MLERDRGRFADAMRRASRDTIREFYQKTPDYRVIHKNLSDMTKVLSGPGTYQKGAWTLHMLRGLIGDAVLFRLEDDLFDLVARGIVKINVNQTYPLKEAALCHRDVESRKTTGSTVLLP